MANKLARPGRKFALQQSALITCIVIFSSMCIYFVWGYEPAKSAALGGFIGILPNILFAYKAFKFAGARASKKVVESFFSGVKQKMILTALLFALAFKFVVLIPLAFFGMFCLVMAMPLITPFIIKQQR
ncbi:ATP synthase subunit I [Colwelliaceae bacterium MEBiC 14330]